jgi:hypothetical protein
MRTLQYVGRESCHGEMKMQRTGQHNSHNPLLSSFDAFFLCGKRVVMAVWSLLLSDFLAIRPAALDRLPAAAVHPE